MKRRQLLTLAASTTTLAFPAIVRSQDKRFAGVTLRMNGYGGDVDRIIMEKVAQPLERMTGAKTVIMPGTTTAALAKAMAARDDSPYDILMLDSPVIPQMIKAQVANPVKTSELKGLERVLPGMREFGDYGVPYTVSSSALVYNTMRVKIPPKSYADLARPDLKDRIAIISPDNGVGLWLLLALNQANGGTPDNAAPGFAALAKLKPNALTITNSTVTVLQLFEQEEIWAACFADGRAVSLKKAGKPIEMVEPTEGTFSMVSYLNPAKNSKNPEAVHAFLEEAAKGELSAAIASFFSYRPTYDVRLPPEVEKSMLRPKNEKAVDWSKVSAHRAEWITQFGKEFK